MTWRRHSCLRRRDSSRRSGTLDGAREEGRDESRPSRQECLRHENGLIPDATTSGVLKRVYGIGWIISPPFQLRGENGQPAGLPVGLVRDAAPREKAVDLWPLITVTPERSDI